MPKKLNRKPTDVTRRSSHSSKRRLALTKENRLDFRRLEDRQMLATLTVSNTTDLTNADTSSIAALIADDGGDGISLREAITATNNTAGEDMIFFDGGVFSGGANSLIRLAQGELEITDSLIIDASIATDVTISGDADGDDLVLSGTFITNVAASFGGTLGAADDLLDDNSRIIRVLSGGLSISNLTLTGGRTVGFEENGGGIFASGDSLSLTNTVISGNSTYGESSYGGGVSGVGDVSVINSMISGNSTVGLGSGGGGIHLPEGTLSVTSSTVSGNSTSGDFLGGGGTFTRGDLVVTNSTFTGNSVSGFNAHGGGFTATGSVALINSTVSGNSSVNARGGGMRASAFEGVLIANSTITGNSAGDSAGGAYLVGNSRDNVSIVNTIIAGNVDNGLAPDLTGHLDRSGFFFISSIGIPKLEHSLIGDTTGSGITETTGTGNFLNQLALIGPLADNGGTTFTHALLTGSPAIDAGSDTLAADTTGAPLATDQRGAGFDRSQFGRPDIGAFESDLDAAPIAPHVLSVTPDEDSTLDRPDEWDTLTVVFDAQVSIAVEDLTLFNESADGSPVDLSGVGFSFDSSTGTATWDFSTLTNPLDAAFYTYKLDANSITYEGLALDGNGDGTAGDDYIGSHYLAIPGDANLDGTVDVLNDAFALVNNLNSTTSFAWTDGNFNSDGIVDVLGDAFLLVGNLDRDVRPTTAEAVGSSTESLTVDTQSLSSPVFGGGGNGVFLREDVFPRNEALDENAIVIKSSVTKGYVSSLVLAGDHELRDDVFGSDF